MLSSASRQAARQTAFRKNSLAPQPTRSRVRMQAFSLLSGLFGGGKSMSQPCQVAPKEAPAGYKLATVAGGCFWGLELAYQRVPGVVSTSVGYTAGQDTAPTYDSVCSGRTGHAEAVQMVWDPKEVTYEVLLDTFFEKVDPTTLNQQGNDRGTQYRSGIYYHDEEQKAIAQQKIAEMNEKIANGTSRRYMGNRVVAELAPAGDYYIAEDYHQQYLAKGGRGGRPQDASKGATEKIRCYG